MLIDIATVERETGIGKDALRVWEKRYGFPLPSRDERDIRLYTQDQVEQLRLIKRLLSNGLRPSKVVGLSVSDLNALLPTTNNPDSPISSDLLRLIEMIKTHNSLELRIALSRILLQQGMSEFLSKTIDPLNKLVGEAWMAGDLRIFEEHLYSDQIVRILRNAISTMSDPSASPRILLTTLPSEEHSLGLLMAEAMLCLSGASCVLLGTQTPVQEIVAACTAHRSDIVVLSFSEAFAPMQLKTSLPQVRNALPDNVVLWVGGGGVARQRILIEGVQVMGPLSDLSDAVSNWRNT
jgi:DNA-binding transcriptional MerR regulator/methylmalonyl-CoA mutase cobalamin-binding subunit